MLAFLRFYDYLQTRTGGFLLMSLIFGTIAWPLYLASCIRSTYHRLDCTINEHLAENADLTDKNFFPQEGPVIPDSPGGLFDEHNKEKNPFVTDFLYTYVKCPTFALCEHRAKLYPKVVNIFYSQINFILKEQKNPNNTVLRNSTLQSWLEKNESFKVALDKVTTYCPPLYLGIGGMCAFTICVFIAFGFFIYLVVKVGTAHKFLKILSFHGLVILGVVQFVVAAIVTTFYAMAFYSGYPCRFIGHWDDETGDEQMLQLELYPFFVYDCLGRKETAFRIYEAVAGTVLAIMSGLFCFIAGLLARKNPSFNSSVQVRPTGHHTRKTSLRRATEESMEQSESESEKQSQAELQAE